LSPIEQDEQPDVPAGGWADESPQPHSWPEADRPREPAPEQAARDDDNADYPNRSEESHHRPEVVDAEPTEPARAIEPAAPAESNGSGAASTVAAPEPIEPPPSGPPKRGWWKRLIE
jgi:hypothetical protein